MAQTQQYDALDSTDGSDLQNKIGWSTVGNLGATTGNFTLYNSSAKPDSNNIVSAYHKPANAATKTGANIARAFGNALAGGILTETACTVSIRCRISSDVNGSNAGWPTYGGSDATFGVILRANGTAYASNKWYEVGFSTITGQSTGTLIIRKVNAGSTTTLATNGIGLPFKFPCYSEAASPALTPANLWVKLTATLTNSGGNVIIEASATVEETGGTQTFVGAVTDSSSPITAAGYGGFFASGNATVANSLLIHFRDFLLTSDAGGATDPADPPEAITSPTIEADPTLSPVSMTKEADALGIFPSLPVQPTYSVPMESERETIQTETEADYVITRPRVASNRRRMALVWEHVTDSDSNTLINFLETMKGGEGTFGWAPPYYGSYGSTVLWCFSSEKFETRQAGKGARIMSAEILEVFSS